uniref:N-alpha-acetyltransferase 16, NatA auxiliary subunit n=1 Tax=Romanomermis culicivorax TaxID=13658 RepID=A0A915K8L6_ROMCU
MFPFFKAAHVFHYKKCYERKEYKSGLKFAKQILSNPKCVEHGGKMFEVIYCFRTYISNVIEETLAMKGLILNCMGKKDEAYDYVKRGLKNDVRSHVCWHVYGLLQRSDKKYDEAIKAYRNALKIDKHCLIKTRVLQENLQILRDLSLLQLQMRDLDGYKVCYTFLQFLNSEFYRLLKQTRYLLFSLRPVQRASWITFAMANHLLRNYDTALKLVDEYRLQQQVRSKPAKALDYEHSELLLYHVMIYREAKRYQEAYDKLVDYEKHIVDKVSLLETKAELLISLDRKTEAASMYGTLLDRNSENLYYYEKLEECLDHSPSVDNDKILSKRLKFYEEMCRKYPRSLAPKRLPLSFTHGASFVSILNQYAKSMLRKGVPPLFVSLRSLYKDAGKISLIEKLFLSYGESLEKTSRFPDEKVSQIETPTTLLWVYYFLALHYDYLKNYEKALQYLDKASQHTPTLIEISTAKAKVYKHSGDFKEAARLMDEAQSLDTADRYVNSKCAKYMLKAGLVSEAEQMCGKFTREGSSPTDNLNEMQCMWFETECALAYFSQNKLGDALKKCHEVERHFVDIIEDQFDFHTYCVRRMTLCAYIRMLRLEDTLRKHRWYFKAARVAIKIYLRLHEKPFDENENADDSITNEQMSSEARKQRRKDKKQQVRNEHNKNLKETTIQHKPPAKKEDQENEEPRKEPLDAKILVKTLTPLDDALKFLKPLLQLNSREIDTYLLGFEVFYRRNKLLMMLHCLKKAAEIDANNRALADCKEKFKSYMNTNRLNASMLELVVEETNSVFLDVENCRKFNNSDVRR